MREDSLMGAEVDATEFTREDRKRHRDKVRKGLDVLARMLTESRFDVERPMAGLEIERECYDLTLFSEDRDEGMRAFAEERTHRYEGR